MVVPVQQRFPCEGHTHDNPEFSRRHHRRHQRNRTGHRPGRVGGRRNGGRRFQPPVQHRSGVEGVAGWLRRNRVERGGFRSAAQVLRQIGRFDHLVYTAGENLSLVRLEDYDIDAARTFFNLRFFSALEAAHLAAPHLNEGGSIVFTSGSAAIRPGAGWMLGAAVSAAAIAVTQALAIELAPIRVNAIAPGVVRSPLWESMSKADQAAMYDGLAASLPLGRVAEVEDVAKSFVYAMDQNYATGTVTVIDGGSVLV